jgi:hypothetical protein
MLKRFLLIGLLCLCLIALVGTDATARCRVIGGVMRCSDLCPVTEGVGAGNVDIKPVAVCVSFAIVDGDGTNCFNQPWNSSEPANDVFNNPFLAGVAGVTSANLTDERGSFLVDFEDYNLCLSWEDDIWPAMAADACPNENWHYVRRVLGSDEDPGFLENYCREDPEDPNYYWCPGRIELMYSWHSSYQEVKGELEFTSGACVRCESYNPDIHDEADVQCDGVGNPIVCKTLDKKEDPDWRECFNKGLDSVCNTAILN